VFPLQKIATLEPVEFGGSGCCFSRRPARRSSASRGPTSSGDGRHLAPRLGHRLRVRPSAYQRDLRFASFLLLSYVQSAITGIPWLAIARAHHRPSTHSSLFLWSRIQSRRCIRRADRSSSHLRRWWGWRHDLAEFLPPTNRPPPTRPACYRAPAVPGRSAVTAPSTRGWVRSRHVPAPIPVPSVRPQRTASKSLVSTFRRPRSRCD